MQWILQRITAISEAVGAPEILSSDDDMALMACSLRTIAALLLDPHLNGYMNGYNPGEWVQCTTYEDGPTPLMTM